MDQNELRQLEAQCIQECAPPCTAACPIHVDVRGVSAEVSRGDFAAALKNAVAGRGNGDLALATSSPRHLAGPGATGAAPLLYRKETQSSVDGNTVDMDIERSQFAENAIHYEAGVAFITHHLRMMSAAMSTGQ